MPYILHEGITKMKKREEGHRQGQFCSKNQINESNKRTARLMLVDGHESGLSASFSSSASSQAGCSISVVPSVESLGMTLSVPYRSDDHTSETTFI
jgi:hypothetical protein